MGPHPEFILDFKFGNAFFVCFHFIGFSFEFNLDFFAFQCLAFLVEKLGLNLDDLGFLNGNLSGQNRLYNNVV